MPFTAAVSFFLSDRHHPVTEDSPIWQARLPLTRRRQPPTPPDGVTWTYGDYFESASRFLSARTEKIADLTSAALKKTILPADRCGLAVYLEKHGAFYHPSRVVVSHGGDEVRFVLNVAVSDIGKATLAREVSCINRLNREFPHRFLPQVHAGGSVALENGRSAELCLGEWFDGYSEFHVTRKNTAGPSSISVWDAVSGPYSIGEDVAAAVYESAAEILTAYYSIETCEQIFSWHHAAGDFVVRMDRGEPRVKLVTVRRYSRLFTGGESGPEAVVNGLLLFFMNMSLRMRIDRRDGVGGLQWLEDFALTGAVKGFFRGLRLKEKHAEVPPGFSDSFGNYLRRIPRVELDGVWAGLVHRFPPESSEQTLIRAHLDSHKDAFCRSLGAGL